MKMNLKTKSRANSKSGEKSSRSAGRGKGFGLHITPFVFSLMFALASCSLSKNNPEARRGPTSTLPYGEGGQQIIVQKPSEKVTESLENKVIQNVAYHVILQTYIDLATAASGLHLKALQLRSKPTQKNLENAQLAWRETRKPWEASESFLFGPVESLGVDPMMDTWPLNRLDMDAILNGSRNLNRQFIGTLGTNVQGFHTAEYLLFGNGEKNKIKTILEMTVRERDYLVAVTDLLAHHAQRLANAWEVNEDPDRPELLGYVVRIMNPGAKNNIYPSRTSVIAELVNGMIGIVDEVSNGKIADPFGSDVNHADVTKVESPFSWNSIADFSNNISSVRAVFTGDYGLSKGPGLKDWVAVKDPELAKVVAEQINISIQSIEDISKNKTMAFRQAVLDPEGRVRIQKAIDQLHILLNLLEREVLPLVN